MSATPLLRRGAARTGADAAVFGWLRYYGAWIAMATIVGAAGFAYASTLLHGIEAWTMIVDTRRELPTRQLGVVAETLFNTLVPDGGDADLQLRPVPDARVLFVVASDDDVDTATDAAREAAAAMTEAFERAGYPGFEVLGTQEPGPIPRRSTTAVFTGLGAAFGLVVAIALALVAYRRRRPVLTIDRARELLRPSSVEVLRGRYRWLGGLRAVPPVPSGGARRHVLAERRPSAPGVLPGAPRHRAASIRRTLHLSAPESEADAAVVVCGAGTPERALRPALRGTRLVWVT